MQPGGLNLYKQPNILIKEIGSHFGTGPGPCPGPGMSLNRGMTEPGLLNNQMGGPNLMGSCNPVRV